jgi:hypothetical protein
LIVTAKKSTKGTGKIDESKKAKKPERSRVPKKDSRAIETEVESKGDMVKKEEKGEIVFAGQFSGNPSLIQSNFGLKGNFELVVPMSNGGLAHYWRNNDDPELPWYGPIKFGEADGRFNSSSLIQSNFGSQGNLELAATEESGKNLVSFWRDSGPSFDWHGPGYIAEPSNKPVFSGNPSLIKSRSERTGNFDLVVPLLEGGFAHYWRDNDDPALPWYGPFTFGSTTGVVYESVTLIQSNFGNPGNLEIVARSRDQWVFFWRGPGPEFKWNGPFTIDGGVAGSSCMIQSKFGCKGNFEVVSPLASGGLGYYWRDNDDVNLPWHGPLMFGTRLGKVDAVTFIQSNFGEPGNLELVANSGGQLAFFWRDSGPDLKWNGPFFSIPA